MKKPSQIMDSPRLKEKDKVKTQEVSSEFKPKQKEEGTDNKWNEIKINGKNICRRSYHSSVVNKDKSEIQ